MLGVDTLRTPHHSRAKQAMRPAPASTAMAEIEPTISHELAAGSRACTLSQARDENAGGASVLGRQDCNKNISRDAVTPPLLLACRFAFLPILPILRFR